MLDFWKATAEANGAVSLPCTLSAIIEVEPTPV
jgi:hypothetical protein